MSSLPPRQAWCGCVGESIGGSAYIDSSKCSAPESAAGLATLKGEVDALRVQFDNYPRFAQPATKVCSYCGRRLREQDARAALIEEWERLSPAERDLSQRGTTAFRIKLVLIAWSGGLVIGLLLMGAASGVLK